MTTEQPHAQIVVSDPKHVVYYQVQAECLTCLAGCGFNFGIDTRLEPFKLLRELNRMLREIQSLKLEQESQIPMEARIIDSISHINRVVKYRIEGYEPAHDENGRYK